MLLPSAFLLNPIEPDKVTFDPTLTHASIFIIFEDRLVLLVNTVEQSLRLRMGLQYYRLIYIVEVVSLYARVVIQKESLQVRGALSFVDAGVPLLRGGQRRPERHQQVDCGVCFV